MKILTCSQKNRIAFENYPIHYRNSSSKLNRQKSFELDDKTGLAFKQYMLNLKSPKRLYFQGNIVTASDYSIKMLALQLNKSAQQVFPDIFSKMEQVLKSVPGDLTGRVKSIESIYKRLVPASGGYCEISHDIIGLRFVLPNGNYEESDRCFNSILSALDNKELDLALCRNHGEYPYLLPEHCEELYKREINYSKRNKSSGYCAAHLYFIDANTKKPDFFELQIRGPYVDDVATKEHEIYKYRTQKLEKGRLLDILSGLSEEDISSYYMYLRQNYIHARLKELGLFTAYPELPTHLPDCLKLEKLKILE